jgi:Protein of unknown function (DUF2384)
MKKNEAREQDQSSLLLTAGIAFWNLVKHYSLSQTDAALLLGISGTNRTRLGSLSASQSIPAESLMSVSHVLGIHKSLRIIYPENRELVYIWLKRPHAELGQKTPLQYIENQSPELRPFAIADLRARLDRERVSGPF